MWSCIECAARIRFRMYCALSGTSSCSAFSTARTDAIACTVVHTPPKRCVNSHASRGSRPCRIRSMPRNICPDDHALRTTPPSTSASMRRWPSMRVTGSMVIRDIALLQCEDREQLDDEDERHQLAGHQAQRDQDLADARKVRPVRARLERDEIRVEPEDAARQHEQHRRAEQVAEPPPPRAAEQQSDGRDDQPELHERHDAVDVERDERGELPSAGDV